MIKNASVESAGKGQAGLRGVTGLVGKRRRRFRVVLGSLALVALVSVVDAVAADGSTHRPAASNVSASVAAAPRHGTRLLVFFASFYPVPG